MKVRTGYLVKNSKGKSSDIFIDSQDKESVYYMFHVYLINQFFDIYVCFNDGTKQKIVLEDDI